MKRRKAFLGEFQKTSQSSYERLFFLILFYSPGNKIRFKQISAKPTNRTWNSHNRKRERKFAYKVEAKPIFCFEIRLRILKLFFRNVIKFKNEIYFPLKENPTKKTGSFRNLSKKVANFGC